MTNLTMIITNDSLPVLKICNIMYVKYNNVKYNNMHYRFSILAMDIEMPSMSHVIASTRVYVCNVPKIIRKITLITLI